MAVAEARTVVVDELDRFGVTDKIGREHIFGSLDEAIAAFRAERAAQR